MVLIENYYVSICPFIRVRSGIRDTDLFRDLLDTIIWNRLTIQSDNPHSRTEIFFRSFASINRTNLSLRYKINHQRYFYRNYFNRNKYIRTYHISRKQVLVLPVKDFQENFQQFLHTFTFFYIFINSLTRVVPRISL